MGEKFSWDRLLKRGNDKDADNTISMLPEQSEAPVAPLNSSGTLTAPRQATVSGPPPVAPPTNTPPAEPKAPLVIDWDQYQATDTGAKLAPIDVNQIPQPAAPTAPAMEVPQPQITQPQPPQSQVAPPQTTEPIAPIQSATPQSQFWNQLEKETQAAMVPTPAQEPVVQAPVEPSTPQAAQPTPTIWESVELTPAPSNPIQESEVMAGTKDVNDFQPIQAEYVRPSDEEIRAKTEEIAKSNAWGEDEPIATPAVQAPVVQTPMQSAPEPTVQPSPEGIRPIQIGEPKFGQSTLQKTGQEDPFQPTGGRLLNDPPKSEFANPTPAASTPPAEWSTPQPTAPVEPVAPVVPIESTFDSKPEATLPPVQAPAATPFETESEATLPPVEAVALPPVQESAPPVAEEPVAPHTPSIWETVTAAATPPVAETPAPNEPNSGNDFWDSVGVPTPAAVEQTSSPTEPNPVTAETGTNNVPENYTKIEEGQGEVQAERDIRVGDLLLKHKLVAPAQLERALERQSETNEKLGQVLISMGLISERRLLQVLASQKGVSAWHLEDDIPNQDALILVPHDACKLFQVLPVAIRGDLLLLAMSDTNDQEAIAAIRSMANKRIEPVLADEARLAYMIDKAYGVVREHEGNRLEEMVEIAHEQEAHLADGTIINPDEPEHLIALVREIMAEAQRRSATSVTVAQSADSGQIYFRILGRLCPVQSIPESLAEAIIANAKANLSNEIAPFEIDQSHKVALSQGTDGESFVVTFPRPVSKIANLSELDIEPENLKLLRNLTDRPFGLVLITGSARSDKETTLASIAQELEQTGRVVARASVGESIAEQINLAVTSESEVIIVGELTNDEDIQAAVKAASSGHLIIAEITANDAPTAIQQLIACGADPYLLATILTGIWCQAIAPKLCQNCRAGRSPSEYERDILDIYGMRHVTQVFESEGCDQCDMTGIDEHLIISEVLSVTPDVRHLITQRAELEKIADQAGFGGYLPMSYDAVTRIIHGQIDFATAKRIVLFNQPALAQISRRDSWQTQAS